MSKRNNVLLAVIGVLIIIGCGVLGGYIIYQNNNSKNNNSNSNNTNKEDASKVQALYDKYKEQGYTELLNTEKKLPINKSICEDMTFYIHNASIDQEYKVNSYINMGEVIFKGEQLNNDYHTGIKNVQKVCQYDIGCTSNNHALILDEDGNIYDFSYESPNTYNDISNVLNIGLEDKNPYNLEKKFKEMDTYFAQEFQKLYVYGITMEGEEYITYRNPKNTLQQIQEIKLENFKFQDIATYFLDNFILKDGSIYTNNGQNLIEDVKVDYILKIGHEDEMSNLEMYFVANNHLYSLNNGEVKLMDKNDIKYIFSSDTLEGYDIVIFENGTSIELPGYGHC